MQTKDNLLLRNILAGGSNIECVLSHAEPESANHLFFHGRVVHELWNRYIVHAKGYPEPLLEAYRTYKGGQSSNCMVGWLGSFGLGNMAASECYSVGGWSM